MRYNSYIRILIPFIFLFAFYTGKAQHTFTFSNLTVENGLSQNAVMAVAQDSVGLMWFGTRQGINRYDGYHFKNYSVDIATTKSKLGEEVTSLLTDFRGLLWAGTSTGLKKYNVNKDRFETVPGLSDERIEVLYQDKSKNLWVGTLGGLNLLVDRNKQTFKPFYFSKNLQDPINKIYAICDDKDGYYWVGTGAGLISVSYQKGIFNFKKINFSSKAIEITAVAKDIYQNTWVGTTNGLYQLNENKELVKSYFHSESAANSLIHNDVREILPNKDGTLLIGTQNGLSYFNPKTGLFTNYQHNPEVNNSISHNSIHHIIKDRNENIWIGTYFGGVNVAYPISTKFKAYRNGRSTTSISGNVISAMAEDEQNNLWIGTEGGGLNYFDRKSNTFKSYKNNPADNTSISSNLVKMLIKDKYDGNNLILGTHRGILNILNTKTGKFQRINNVKDAQGNIGSAEIIALAQDKSGKLWIGSYNGISTLERKQGKYPTVTTISTINNSFKDNGVLNLLCDTKGNLWIGTTEGLYNYNLSKNKLSKFIKGNEKDELQSAYINCVVESANGNLLIGTYMGGLSIYDPKQNTFKTYRESDGLINDNVLGIVEDNSKNLWISTAKGLSELNLKTHRFRNYTKSDGLAGNEFNIRSYFKDTKGEIFFGGFNGFTSFYPQEIQLNSYVSPLVFTGLRLFNKPVTVGTPDEILKNNLNLTEDLNFTYDQNNFTLEFALLNYVKPDKNKYTYNLEGYDKEWKSDTSPIVSYANLPAGNYRFVVKATNNDGVPTSISRTLKIHISPAPWLSWWAYLTYTLVFFTILFLTLRYFFVRALLKRTKNEQQMKLSFFTHVSHEIRTPLTLILGPLETLLKSTDHLPEINNQVVPIKNNADRLLRLVTELLDFRKTETGNLKLHLAEQDIVPFVQQIFNAFKELASSRNINYQLTAPSQPLPIWMDQLQLEKVFFNLLSNAFKFTHDNGTISVSITETNKQIVIEVRDNGIGIPENSRDKLFSDFFQIDSSSSGHIGSGIGLALTKSIVVAHGGEISIDSIPQSKEQPGDTRFKVSLQKGKSISENQNEVVINEMINSNYQVPILPTIAIAETPIITEHSVTVLIVEDNREIRQMLSGLLYPFYNVIETENGQKGWETATEQMPDLIICDIMMPIMNGLELCGKLKTDNRTSHIPVILLTAMDTIPQQVDGLETGADSYITKPFSVELLLLNVKNLLQARRIMRMKFTEEVNLQPQDITINKTDHHFTLKVIDFIEGKMTDQHFVIQDLANEVGMSQPVLYKKIRAITGLSVNDFIKSIRLKKAHAFLLTGQYNISEISYLVGFNDVKYFSREFKKQYGKTPKAYLTSKD